MASAMHALLTDYNGWKEDNFILVGLVTGTNLQATLNEAHERLVFRESNGGFEEQWFSVAQLSVDLI